MWDENNNNFSDIASNIFPGLEESYPVLATFGQQPSRLTGGRRAARLNGSIRSRETAVLGVTVVTMMSVVAVWSSVVSIELATVGGGARVMPNFGFSVACVVVIVALLVVRRGRRRGRRAPVIV